VAKDVAYAIRAKFPEAKSHWVCIGDVPEQVSNMAGPNYEMVLVGEVKPIEDRWLKSEEKINRIKSIVEDWGQGRYVDAEGKIHDIRSDEAKLRAIRKVIASANVVSAAKPQQEKEAA
jgi:hypothetical protein